jgi:hypothetical protein
MQRTGPRGRRGIAAASASIADELKKLVELHHSGVLTVEEFNELKGKLIGKDGSKSQTGS